MDKFREECGVFGIFGHTEASNLTYLGLYALQHRGQESAGIAASDGHVIRIERRAHFRAVHKSSHFPTCFACFQRNRLIVLELVVLELVFL